jgi:hypothetical protein
MKRIALLLTLSGITLTLSNNSWAAADAARVGDRTVSRKSLVNVERFYTQGRSGEDTVTAVTALGILIKKELTAQILAKNGHTLSDADLERETPALEADAAQAANFKRMKDIVGTDRIGYLHDFVMIPVSESTLKTQVYIPRSAGINSEIKSAAELFLKNVRRSPASLERAATKQGYRPMQVTASSRHGISRLSGGEQRELLSRPLSQASGDVEAAAAKLKKGDFLPQVIEARDCFLILRYAGKFKGEAFFDAVAVPKKEYQEWFWEQALEFPVIIYDKGLKSQFRKRASWASKLNLQ